MGQSDKIVIFNDRYAFLILGRDHNTSTEAREKAEKLFGEMMGELIANADFPEKIDSEITGVKIYELMKRRED